MLVKYGVFFPAYSSRDFSFALAADCDVVDSFSLSKPQQEIRNEYVRPDFHRPKSTLNIPGRQEGGRNRALHQAFLGYRKRVLAFLWKLTRWYSCIITGKQLNESISLDALI